MISWGQADRADLAPPTAAAALLAQAVSARPDSPLLRLKLADVLLERYDFASAAASLEAALDLDPELAGARSRLGRCYNALGRHRDALEALRACPGPLYERAMALTALGEAAEAEAELKALLSADPEDRQACRQLGKILRRSDRIEELLATCQSLHARGAGHAQLLYTWGTALALAGREEEARAILFDPSRVVELALPVPSGFCDISAFNAALAEEILSNPYRLSDFPVEDEANRGSSRVHALFAGRRPELVRQLLDALQAIVDRQEPPRAGPFDPWLGARPQNAHLKSWGLIQRGSDYEEWHSHPGGWMSGVYYMCVPRSVSAEDEGPGCIEFGPPPPVARAMPDFIPPLRHAPREGTLLLAPSHYAHRTIPSGADEYRISFAFDVVPDAA
jgi:tetratricopeptide (TPR) repeat protein